MRRPPKKSVNRPHRPLIVSQPSSNNCRRTSYTNGLDICCTRFPFQQVRPTRYRDRTRVHELPAVLVRLEQSLPLLRSTNAVFVVNDAREIVKD